MSLTDTERLNIALKDLLNLERERTLLKGHFSLVAKRHKIKVTPLINAYKEVTGGK